MGTNIYWYWRRTRVLLSFFNCWNKRTSGMVYSQLSTQNNLQSGLQLHSVDHQWIKQISSRVTNCRLTSSHTCTATVMKTIQKVWGVPNWLLMLCGMYWWLWWSPLLLVLCLYTSDLSGRWNPTPGSYPFCNTDTNSTSVYDCCMSCGHRWGLGHNPPPCIHTYIYTYMTDNACIHTYSDASLT